MFGLGKSKFYKKSKRLLKLSKTRIDTIRKKRNAVLKYLKNDIAELLRNGLDVDAYSRAEGLLVELNMSSCYDFIEQCIMCISGQLSAMDKQRECPSECRESIPSLMYAAARFADLPELRDLRTLFTERFGTSLELFINREFVGKLRSGHPTKEKKLQLLQDISQENSIQWDSKSLEREIFKTPPPVQDKPNHESSVSSYGSENNRDNQHKRKDDALPARDAHNAGNKMSVMTEYDVPKRNEEDFMHNGRKVVPDDRYNEPISSDDEVVSSHRRDSTSQDSRQNSSSSIGSFYEDEVDSSKPFYYGSIPPPYVKQNAAKEGRTIEDTIESVGFDNAKQNNLQYPPVNKDQAQPTSTRRSTLRPPPGHEIVDSGREESAKKAEKTRQGLQSVLKVDQSDEEEKKLDQLLMCYSKKKPPRESSKVKANHYPPPPGQKSDDVSRATRHSARANLYPQPGQGFDDCTEQTRHSNATANLRTPSSHEKDNYIQAARHRNAGVNLYPPPGQESDDANGAFRARHGIGAANLYHPPGQQDDEDNGVRRHRNARSELPHPPARATSFPLEQAAAHEATKGHARAISVQPDMLTRPGHVHPKLPDYDDLAARFAALRGQ